MSRVSTLSRRSLLVITLLLAALLVGETVVLAVATVRIGGAAKSVKVATDVADSTFGTGGVWHDVTGMSVNMTVPSGQKGLFLVTFTAITSCIDGFGNSAVCSIRALADGQVASPGFLHLDAAGDGEEDASEANSVQFVFGPANAGTYTIKVQAHISEPSTTFRLSQKILTVVRHNAS